MADQMVQLSFGQRSLSKVLQAAQLEGALEQLIKNKGKNVLNANDLENQVVQ